MRREQPLHQRAHGAVPQRGQPVEGGGAREQLGAHAAAVGVAVRPVQRPRLAIRLVAVAWATVSHSGAAISRYISSVILHTKDTKRGLNSPYGPCLVPPAWAEAPHDLPEPVVLVGGPRPAAAVPVVDVRLQPCHGAWARVTIDRLGHLSLSTFTKHSHRV